MGEHAIDPSAVKAKDTVKTMEYSIQHLIDQMNYIARQQDYQRVRHFSSYNGFTNFSVTSKSQQNIT